MKLMKDIQLDNILVLLEHIWRRHKGKTSTLLLIYAHKTNCDTSLSWVRPALEDFSPLNMFFHAFSDASFGRPWKGDVNEVS